MASPSEEHSNISRDFLAKAEAALADDDLLQASEKGWGAAAHVIKAVAENRGWRHDGHRALYQAANRLAQETEGTEIRGLFSLAGALHSNFYENWMPPEMVAYNLAQVRDLLEKLESLS